ncbi:MAG: hypothetical protein ACJ8GW_14230 [Massilia sp.]
MQAHTGKTSTIGHPMKTIGMNATLQVLAASLLLGMLAPANAQLLKYENRDEIYGAAAVSPESTRQILKGIVEVCSKVGNKPRDASVQALAEWEQRHTLYFEENELIKKEMITAAQKPGASSQHKKFIEQLFAVTLPQSIKAQITAFTTPMETVSDPGLKTSYCMSFAGSITDGKWDLKNNDPVVAKFLDERIDKRK